MAFPLGAALSLGGSVIGALSGRKGSTQTTTNEPPSFLRPYAPAYADTGMALGSAPYPVYDANRVAGFSGDQFGGMDMMRNQAQQTSPLWGQSQGLLSDTIGGKFLSPDSNPYLRGMYDQAANRVSDAFARGTAAQTDSAAARAGAFGGSAWQEMQNNNQQALGDTLGNMATNMYGQAYNQERGLQNNAMQFAPQFAGAQQQYGFNNANALLGIGGMQQAYGQANLDADYNQYLDARQWPFQTFDVMQRMFAPSTAPGSTQTIPGVGAGQGAIGGALAGSAFNRMWNPQTAGNTQPSMQTAMRDPSYWKPEF